jgi:hypothetical protein
VKIIQDEGLSVPRKSGCYICPFQRNNQWKELWANHSDLFHVAQMLEEEASKRTKRFITFDPSGKVSLAVRRVRYESQTSMFDDAEMDGLLEYKPCLCGL